MQDQELNELSDDEDIDDLIDDGLPDDWDEVEEKVPEINQPTKRLALQNYDWT